MLSIGVNVRKVPLADITAPSSRAVGFLFDAGRAIPDRISIDRVVNEVVSRVIHR